MNVVAFISGLWGKRQVLWVRDIHVREIMSWVGFRLQRDDGSVHED